MDALAAHVARVAVHGISLSELTGENLSVKGPLRSFSMLALRNVALRERFPKY
jgi:hypothetical protein